MFIESLLHVKNQTKVLSQSCENGVADKWTDRTELIRPLRRAKSPRSCLVGRSVITQHPHHSKSDQYSLLCINTNYSLKKLYRHSLLNFCLKKYKNLYKKYFCFYLKFAEVKAIRKY